MSEGEAPDVSGALSKKIGPLPVGAWLLAAAGGIGVALFVRSRRAGADQAQAEAAATVPDGTVYTQPNGIGQGGSSGSGGSSDDTPTVRTNSEWAQVAVRRMIARGYDPTAVDVAVRAYLSGDHLSSMQRAIIAEILVFVGPPPTAPPPESPGPPVVVLPPVITPVVDPPLPPPPPAPVVTAPPPPVWTPPVHRYPELRTWHTHVTNDNYSRLAQQYGLNISGEELYQYQFTAQANRSEDAKRKLRQRGSGLIYAGGSTAIPYNR